MIWGEFWSVCCVGFGFGGFFCIGFLFVFENELKVGWIEKREHLKGPGKRKECDQNICKFKNSLTNTMENKTNVHQKE